jgi:hypothetical protein
MMITNLRHGSCDEYSEPKLFKSKVNAEKYVAEEIADAICESLFR